MVTNDAGLPDFDALQKAVHSDPYAMILGAFDIMYLDGHDLRDVGCKAPRDPVRDHQAEQQDLFQRIACDLLSRRPGGARGDRFQARRQPVSQRPDVELAEDKELTVEEYGLLGVEREPGKAAFACWRSQAPGNMSVRTSSVWVAR
ncbi:MAG: hypothetical protein E5W67_00195 [Mesorhizobium sp.]|nr:MAG: hypothetical protein E5W67_00195 [Mesorhizobium sp.]